MSFAFLQKFRLLEDLVARQYVVEKNEELFKASSIGAATLANYHKIPLFQKTLAH